MPKRTSADTHKISQVSVGEPTPPFLSEKLIAQLQGAVSAARRKRISKLLGTGNRSAEKES